MLTCARIACCADHVSSKPDSGLRRSLFENSLFSTQHILHKTLCFAYHALKRERAEDRAYVGLSEKYARVKMYAFSSASENR